MRCSELTPEYIHATIRLLKGGEGPPGIENSDSPLITKSKGEPVSSVRNGELPSKSNDTSYFAENDEVRQKIRVHVKKALEVERANEAYRQKVRAKINEYIIIFGELRFPRLIPCRLRTKVPWLPWKKGFDNEDILNGFYGEKLIEGFDGKANLAVHLGCAESFNLKCVDVDEDGFLEPFILANQAFAETFCVKGQRGAKFFYYEKGESADYVRTLKVNGEKAGEFRGGELAMIAGIHECGKPYEWINPVPPIAFRFSDIVWSEGWVLEERASKKPRGSRPAILPEGRGPAGIGPVCWEAVRQFQKDNAEELVESFLDNAIKESGRYLIGDKYGNPSRKDKGSCSITVSGEYSGCWKDWATGETGTIKDIIGNFHELTELQVVEEYEKWGDESLRWPAQTAVSPAVVPPIVPKSDAARKPELLLPGTFTEYIATAADCFPVLAETKEFFVQGGVPMELTTIESELKLTQLTPESFQSRLEEHFTLTKYVVGKDGDPVLTTSRCSAASAKTLLDQGGD